MVRLTPVLALLAFAVHATAVAQEAAPEQQGCNEDYVAAQRARKEGKLLEARQHMLACSRELCMDVIEKDCVTWLQDVDRSLPSVVVVARDRWGDETLNVRVLVDGAIVRDVLDAKAISVDPGAHTFRFETPDETPVEQKVIVREGEQNRRVEVRFGAGNGAVDTERPPPEGGGAGFRFDLRDLGWVLGGTGVASVIGATLFWVSASAAEGDLEDTKCAPACEPASVDAIDRQRVIGDVLAGVGVASIGAAVYLLVWGTGGDDEGGGSAMRVDLRAGPGGAYASVHGDL